MTVPQPAPGQQEQVLPDGGSSSLADGEWHRMHPLTPLFKGGLVLIVIAGFVIANLRERIIGWLVNIFVPDVRYGEYGGDPVDWVLNNNFALLALGGVLLLLVVLVAIFWFVWRFQQFRITGSHVEVRKGIVFRSHRRAPLDRVQGVNLTRPFPARIIGLAKIEVVGAGTDSNVDLEYLATAKAESVRADILRLASGIRTARAAAAAAPVPADGTPAPTARQQFAGAVNTGVEGLITGVDLADVAPESVVKIPTGRLVGSQAISGVIWLIFFGLIFAVTLGSVLISSLNDPSPTAGLAVLGVSLGMGIPLIVAAIGITWAQISKSLRYSIAPTPDGIRLTFGLLTTITETLPPGRIFAVEVTQSLLWRPFGWWSVRINRMSGKSASQQQSGTAQQFNIVLPVGKRADVERVLGLVLPDVPAADIPLIWEHGVLGPIAGDPYRTTAKRAWWVRPLSWKRQGYAVTDFGLLVRRGVIWRKLAIFPLARLQGLSVNQGPIARAQGVAGAQAHSVTGPVSGHLSGLERDDAMHLLRHVSRAAVLAAANDHTHRWAESSSAPTAAPAYPAPSAGASPAYPPAPAPAYPPAPGAAPHGYGAPPVAPPAGTVPPAPGSAMPPAPGSVAPPAPPAAPVASPAAPVAPPAAPVAPPAAPVAPPAAPVAPPAAPVAPPAGSVPPAPGSAVPPAPPASEGQLRRDRTRRQSPDAQD
ncbi:PH domain-containing protein [Microbacterium sp.]|uniref:PH domain-containing protein n=1 Tax=Microbacterium sp. TaxID=51671 RepID=UPI003341A8B9